MLGLLGMRVLVLSTCEFSDISIIVGLKFIEEHLCFIRCTVWYEVFIKKVQNVLADSGQFLFNFALVSLDFLHVLLVTLCILLLLN